jgi:hypothetical protein
MPYVTGTAADLSGLRTGILNACTANGWTLTGTILSKGAVFITLTVNGNFLDLHSGTGASGGVLTGTPGATRNARIGTLTSGMAPFAWPLTYEVFIGSSPDEVYAVITYSGVYHQWLAWGQSSITTPGTGAWYSGSLDSVSGLSSGLYIVAQQTSSQAFGGRASSSTGCPALFWASTYNFTSIIGESINHGLPGSTSGWSGHDINAAQYRAPLDFCLPSAWSSETVLLPIQMFSTAYGSSKVAMVADLAHARACRINNLTPGQIITLGADKWKAFPWYLKSAAPSSTSTGGLGWAIRYDGP